MNEHERREIEMALDKLRPHGERLIEAGWRAELLVLGPTELDRLGSGYKAALVLPLDHFSPSVDDEVLGGEEEDDTPDVWGDQAPVNWSEQSLSDERLSGEARAKLEAAGALLP